MKAYLKKTPHAFLEGELIAFEGKIRDKEPIFLQQQIINLKSNVENKIQEESVLINYNPRFANCFYKNEKNKENIDKKFVSCEKTTVIGWNFFAINSKFELMKESNFSNNLDKTSLFEKISHNRGIKRTSDLLLNSNNNLKIK